MGDYTKLIVHAEVRETKEQLEKKVEDLGLYESAYHCDGVIKSIEERNDYGGSRLCVTLVGQTKYGCGQEEFLNYLEPLIIQGSGVKGIWAFQLDEYGSEPRYRAKRPSAEGDYE